MRKGTMLQAAGLAMYQNLQGLLASFADKTSAGQVYASATIIELIGSLSGRVVFAAFWEIGLGIPYSWGIGFPYFVAAVSLSSFTPFLSRGYQYLCGHRRSGLVFPWKGNGTAEGHLAKAREERVWERGGSTCRSGKAESRNGNAEKDGRENAPQADENHGNKNGISCFTYVDRGKDSKIEEQYR